jgi:hypothetical protein
VATGACGPAPIKLVLVQYVLSAASQAAAVIVTLPGGSVSGRGLQLRQPLETVPGCQLHLLETIALRAITVNVRSLAVIGRGGGISLAAIAADARATDSGSVSASHWSSRLESVWRTLSPSHSTISSSASVLTCSGTVWHNARWALLR